MTDKSPETPKTQRIKVTYEDTSALYASQFLVHAGAEEIVVNLSSGYISEPGSEELLLPIHSRVALSFASAQRLVASVSKALEQCGHGNNTQGVGDSAQAKFPSMGPSNATN